MKMYLVQQTLCSCLGIREKSTNSSPGPTEHQDGKGDLNSVAWMYKVSIISGPKGCGKLDELGLPKWAFNFACVHGLSFPAQGLFGPLNERTVSSVSAGLNLFSPGIQDSCLLH